MSTPFKMKGSPMQRNFGISPLKTPGDHPHDKEGNDVVKEKHDFPKEGTRTITKSKGSKSSTYSLTKTEKNYQGTGRTKLTFTNELGNTEIRTHDDQ